MGEPVWMGTAAVLALGVFVPLMAPDMGLGLAPADPPVPLDPAVRLLVGPGLGAPGGPSVRLRVSSAVTPAASGVSDDRGRWVWPCAASI